MNELQVGCYYRGGKQNWIRRIREIKENGDIFWEGYDEATGRKTGDFLICSEQHFRQWMRFQLTPEEIERFEFPK